MKSVKKRASRRACPISKLLVEHRTGSLRTVDPRRFVNLPFRPFLYTLDQIQDLLLVNDLNPLIYWDGRSVGIHHPYLIKAINLMPNGVKPEWRVEEVELLRWMRNRGFQIFYRDSRPR